MKHGYFGRKLGRNKDERKQLFRVLLRALVKTGKMKTTIGKAKAIQPTMEHLITKAKLGTSSSLRSVQAELADNQTYKLLLEMTKTRFAARTSGYTRLIKLGARRGDAAEEVILEFVDAAPKKEEPKKTDKKKGKAPAEKVAPVVQEAEVVTEEPKKKPARKPKTDK